MTASRIPPQGPDALSLLQHLCSGNVDVPVGSSVYTQMLNHKGGIESDVTTFRLKEDKFYLVSSTGQATRDMAWIERTRGPHCHTGIGLLQPSGQLIVVGD